MYLHILLDLKFKYFREKRKIQNTCEAIRDKGMLPGFPYKQKLQERCFKQFPYDIYHCQGCKMPMENTDKFFFSLSSFFFPEGQLKSYNDKTVRSALIH